MYTSVEYERARAYARERMEAEGVAISGIMTILEECASVIVSLMSMGASQDEIDDAIDSLVDSILDWIDTMAVNGREDGDGLLLWLHDDWNDGALEDVTRKRADTFLDEVMTVCAVGFIMGKGVTDILNSISENMREPWNNSILQEAKEKEESGEISLPDDIDIEERHYGKGIPVSSLVGLESLTQSAVADYWTMWRHNDYMKGGAKGYFVERGSSYPCDECQSHVGVFWPIDDTEHLPQYHPHCRCFVVYSFVDRL